MDDQRSQCMACDAPAVLEDHVDVFKYGDGDEAAEISAIVPVWICSSRLCGLMICGEGAEELRHAAVCAHLDILSPQEIKAVRARFEMTQEQFSRMTGFGIASIKRWESGHIIQSKSADNYLKMLLALPLDQAKNLMQQINASSTKVPNPLS